MNPFPRIVSEMREKRLWPIALLLLVLLVALPIVLSKSSSPSTTAEVTPALPGASATPTPNVPAIQQQVTPVHSHLTAHRINPFGSTAAQPKTKTGTPTSSGTTGSQGTQSPSSSQKTGSGSSGGSSSTSTTPTTASTTPTTTTTTTTTTPSNPTTPTKPTHQTLPKVSGLTPTEVYDVAFSMSNSSGGFDTIDPLRRLSPIPSTTEPLLVELGVLKGGKRTLFAVRAGTSVQGPGRCIPGVVDCQILSLGKGQVENLSGFTGGGMVYDQFSVTKITVHHLHGKKATQVARREESGAGRSLLQSSSYPALSLFSYQPTIGAIVDKRNLGAGTSN